MPAPFPHSCTVTRPPTVDPRPIDEESGQPVGEAPDPVVVYSGRCFFDESAQSVKREMGGDVAVEGKAVLVLPKAAALFDHDTDVITVTANGYTYSGLSLIKTSYTRRRTVLVIDLKNRPVPA